MKQQKITQWLNAFFPERTFSIQPMNGDASLRSYYRIHFNTVNFDKVKIEDKDTLYSSLVLMDAPPPQDISTFIDIQTWLSKQSLSVPKIIAKNQKEGMLLLSDFGDRLYLNELSHTPENLYQDALTALLKMQKKSPLLPSFDYAFLERQMAIFNEWYLKTHLKITDDDLNYQKTLKELLQLFWTITESQPSVFVHRDYHSRNLMILDAENPGILDFQDAMLGPMSYDLVSLLQDCYIAWPRDFVLEWVEKYLFYARELSLIPDDIEFNTFIRWFDLTGVQRHLKNLGIFSRLHYRDGKSHYLKDLNMPLKYVKEAVERYPELENLGVFMQTLEKKQ